MSRAWFFQANPKLYDVDDALARLDHIWWRVPQYASRLCVGDMVLIWCSGADAGVVGVDRITTEPQARSAPDPAEAPFFLNVATSSTSAAETRWGQPFQSAVNCACGRR